MLYDMKCFAMSLAVLAVVASWTRYVDATSPATSESFDLFTWVHKSAQFRENLFWCKVLYGFSSLPFLPFMIPVFCKVLTRCEYTGYNENGACVEFQLPELRFTETSVSSSPTRTRIGSP